MHKKNLLPAVAALAMVGTAQAGSVVSHSFNAVLAGEQALSTAGLLDWGFLTQAPGDSGIFDSNRGGAGSLNDVPFGSVTRDEGNVITTVSGTSQIGTVTLTEGAGTDVIGAQSNASPYTFDGNPTGGAYGGFAPTEQDIWTIKLNDLGVGTFTVTLYLGHSNVGRGFDMDIILDDSGDVENVTTQVNPLSSLPSTVGFAGGDAFTHTVTVTTTTPGADLSLIHGGTGGSFGGALLAGYTVDGDLDSGPVIPQPAAFAMGLLGLGALAARRRRG